MKLTNRYSRRLPVRVLATLLGLVLGFSPLLAAQTVSPPVAEATPHSIQIVILEDEGALNNIRQREAREPIVQVQDENHKPVAGALVIFLINFGDSGAGASFNGLTSLTTTTNAAGQAVAHGFVPNGISGNYTISVHASYGNLSANTTIQQSVGSSSNSTQSQQQPVPAVTPVAHHGVVKWTLIGGGVAGAAILTFLLVHHGINGTTITSGNGTVGP
jgi:hypothetical protein